MDTGTQVYIFAHTRIIIHDLSGNVDLVNSKSVSLNRVWFEDFVWEVINISSIQSSKVDWKVKWIMKIEKEMKNKWDFPAQRNVVSVDAK